MYKTLSIFFSGFTRWFRPAFNKPATTLNQFKALDGAGEGINCIVIHAFSHGSEPAFRRIYDHYAPAIYRVSVRNLQSEQLAADLVQEVFSALWLKKAKFTEPEAVRLFLFTMAKNTAVKYLKKMAETEIRSQEPEERNT
jgi:hypothetical protein